MAVSSAVQKIDRGDSNLKMMKYLDNLIDVLRHAPYCAPSFYMISTDEEECLASSTNTTESLDEDEDALGGSGTEDFTSGGSFNW